MKSIRGIVKKDTIGMEMKKLSSRNAYRNW